MSGESLKNRRKGNLCGKERMNMRLKLCREIWQLRKIKKWLYRRKVISCRGKKNKETKVGRGNYGKSEIYDVL